MANLIRAVGAFSKAGGPGFGGGAEPLIAVTLTDDDFFIVIAIGTVENFGAAVAADIALDDAFWISGFLAFIRPNPAPGGLSFILG